MLGFGRKRALEVDQKDVAVIERLLTGDVGRQLRAEAAEELRAERAGLIDSIVATQASIERDGPQLQKALRDAEVELERAEKIAAAARAKRAAAVNAIASFSSKTEKAILLAQRKLRETADRAIDELVLEIDRAWEVWRNRTAIQLPSGSESDPEATGPGQRVRTFVSYSAALGERLQLLRTLRDEAAELALSHAGDPSQAIADIRARVPSPDAPLTAEHYTEQKPRMVRAR
jgi:hypothetical protein